VSGFSAFMSNFRADWALCPMTGNRTPDRSQVRRHLRQATNSANFRTILKLGACALGGALAAVVVLAGAVLATVFTLVLAVAQGLRPLGRGLPRLARRAPLRARAVAHARLSAYFRSA
jgi:hypothetical protein